LIISYKHKIRLALSQGGFFLQYHSALFEIYNPISVWYHKITEEQTPEQIYANYKMQLAQHEYTGG